MKEEPKTPLLRVLMIVLLFSLASCGGGSSGSSSGSAAPRAVTTVGAGSVTGTGAAGSAIANATVSLIDSKGATATGATDANGNFTISGTSGLTPPFLLSITSGTTTFYSISADGNTTTTININPLTDLIIRSWYIAQGTTVEAAFANPAANPPPAPSLVNTICSLTVDIVADWLRQQSVNTAGFNPISTPFTANHTGFDKVLDMIGSSYAVDQSGRTISLTITDSAANISKTSTITITPAGGSTNGSITVSTTSNTGDSSPQTMATLVPTAAQAAVLSGIITTFSNLANTANQKGASITASDLTPYVDPDFQYNGWTADQYKTSLAANIAGMGASYSFNGLVQLNSWDAANAIADVTAYLATTKDGVTAMQPMEDYFKQVNGTWLMTGNHRVAAAYALAEADYIPPGQVGGEYTYANRLTLEVDDPTGNTQSATVTGPGLAAGGFALSVSCSAVAADCNGGACPSCDDGYTQKSFVLDFGSWPTLPATYVFTLNTANSGSYTYQSTVGPAYGYNAAGTTPIPADYPIMTLTPTPTWNEILNGTTITGTVYVPIWESNPKAPQFAYGGPSGTLSGTKIEGVWNSVFPVPGQTNTFTITAPAATVTANSGGVYTINFGGQNGLQVSSARFSYYANYGNADMDNDAGEDAGSTGGTVTVTPVAE